MEKSRTKISFDVQSHLQQHSPGSTCMESCRGLTTTSVSQTERYTDANNKKRECGNLTGSYPASEMCAGGGLDGSTTLIAVCQKLCLLLPEIYPCDAKLMCVNQENYVNHCPKLRTRSFFGGEIHHASLDKMSPRIPPSRIR